MRRAVDLGLGTSETGDAALGGVEVEGVAVPTVAATHRAPERRVDVAADVQRRDPRRPRLGPHAGERHEAAVERRCFVGPDGDHGVEVLVGAGALVVERRPDRVELGLEVADADTEQEAAAADPVEGLDPLRQHQRLVQRDHGEAGAEQQRRGVGGQERQAHERVEHGEPPGSRRCRHTRLGQDVVLAGPHALPAGGLGGDRDLRRCGWVDGEPVDVDGEQPELHPHGCTSGRSWRMRRP